MNVNILVANVGNKIFGKKWRVVIVLVLKDGPLRFSQVKAKLPDCSVKVLSESLQELEQHRIVIRKQYNTIPVKVTYELNDHMQANVMVITDWLRFLSNHVYIHQDLYKLTPEFIEQVETRIEDEAQEG